MKKLAASKDLIIVAQCIDTKKLHPIYDIKDFQSFLARLRMVFPRTAFETFELDVAMNLTATTAGHPLTLFGKAESLLQKCSSGMGAAQHLTYPKLGVNSFAGHSSRVTDAKTTSNVLRVKSYAGVVEKASRDSFGRSVFCDAMNLVRLCCLGESVQELASQKRMTIEEVSILLFHAMGFVF